jgi:hypothetical protein
LPIVGHNIQFDISFLNANGLNITNPLYDTFPFSSVIFPDLPTYSLEVLTEILNLSHEEKHRALEDSIAAMELFLKLSEKFQELPTETIDRIHKLCKKTSHPLGAFLLTLKPKTAQEKSELTPATAKISTSEITTTSDPQTAKISSTKKSPAKTSKTSTNQLSIFEENNPQTTQETSQFANNPPTPQPPTQTNPQTTPPPTPAPIHSAPTSRILDPKENLLIELSPPYESLIKNLLQQLDKDSYISVPSEIFQKIFTEIPDSIAKIESPKKYISTKRFEKLLQKPHIQDHEFTAFSKAIIWLNETKTGLLHELSFLNQEKQLVNELSIDENLLDPSSEEFFAKGIKKDISSPTICSHHFLGNTTTSHSPQFKPKNLIIIDFDKFVKTLHFESSYYLKLEILLTQISNLPTTDPATNSSQLSTSATILFGLIGMILDHFTDDNQFVERCTITQNIIETKQWEKALHSAQNLIALLNETKDPILEKSAKTLSEFFITPNLDSNLLLIEKDMDGNAVIKKSPFEVKPQIEKILSNCESYKIINESVDLNDNGKFLKHLFGLPEGLKTIKSENLPQNNESKSSSTHDSSPAHPLEIFIADKPNYYSREDRDLMKNIAKYIETREGAVAIIANSRQQMEFFTLELGKIFKDTTPSTPPRQVISLLTGSIGKISEQFKINHKNAVLIVTPNAWNNFKYSSLVNSLIVNKIPFDPPSDPYLIAASKNFEDPFNELQVPLAIFALKRIINRINQTASDTTQPATQSLVHKEVIILDDRLSTKNYGKTFLENLKNIAHVSPFLPIQ